MGRNISFVPTITYLGIIEAYIHPAQGGSGSFKAGANSPVGRVELGSCVEARAVIPLSTTSRLTGGRLLPCVVLLYNRGLLVGIGQ